MTDVAVQPPTRTASSGVTVVGEQDPTRARATALAWTLAGVAAALAVTGGVFHLMDRHVPTDVTRWWVTNIVQAIGLGLPGAMIASRRPRNPIGWLFMAVAIAQALTVAGREYAVYALAIHSGGLPGGAWGAWVGAWGYTLSFLMCVALLLFPSGRVRSPAVAVSLALLCLATGVATAISAFYPAPVLQGAGAVTADNPVGWNGIARFVNTVGMRNLDIFLTISVALGLVCLLSQLHGATPRIRRQLLVVGLPATLLCSELIFEFWTYRDFQPVVAPVCTILFSIAVAASMLRYGLYEIDRAVNRAIVYAAASAVLLGAYLGTVAVADAIFGHRTLTGSLIAAALVAMLFAPLRVRLQAAGDRMLYGARRDPYLVMSSLGEQLPAATAALPALAETVARMLKLPFVAIELRDGSTDGASVGSLRGEPVVIPLVFQGAHVGRLIIGRRAPDDHFTRGEQRLFDDVARQVAVAAYAVSLTTDLQRSRERLVTAREEERRRIRRDLHDGLGPTLAGIGLQLDAARSHLLLEDVSVAEEMLDGLVHQTSSSIAEIRRLVDDLRPPALDEFGLASALREQASRFPGMQVEVIAGDDIKALPAAVEVAAYRIATEAVTNAARHSGARRCTVRLVANGALDLDIIDDGCGLPVGWRAGLGVTSIRERVAELGGSCHLSAAPGGGTVVRARIPVGRP